MDAKDFEKRIREIPSAYINRDVLKDSLRDVEVNFRGTMSEIKTEIERVKNQHKEKEKKAREEHSRAYNKIMEDFKQYLFEDNGVANNPKREKIYAYAYEKGHDNGLDEIEDIFMDIAEIVRD